MFTVLRLHDPAMQVDNPKQARAWATTSLTCLPKEIYNRDPAGQLLTTANLFSVGPDRGGVEISAVGRDAAAHLRALAKEVRAQFLAKYPEGSFLVRIGVADIRVGPTLRDYALHDFVLQNTASRRGLWEEWKEKPDEKGLTALAERLFRERVEARAELVGVTLPDDVLFGDFKALPIRPVLAGAGSAKFAVALEFRSNAEFIGPWNFGPLASRSAGRLIEVRRPRRLAYTGRPAAVPEAKHNAALT